MLSSASSIAVVNEIKEAHDVEEQLKKLSSESAVAAQKDIALELEFET